MGLVISCNGNLLIHTYMTTEMKASTLHVVTLQVCLQVCFQASMFTRDRGFIFIANGIGLISLGLQKCLGNKVSTGEDTDSRLPESENVVEEK